MRTLEIFDSTLRDGAQSQSISFSVMDKLHIVKALDDLGISYIEAGNPGSNPKDLEFFRRLCEVPLQHAKIVAFGSTRRRDIAVEQDANVQALLGANTSHVAIFGKSWDFHVTEILRTTPEENLRMIYDTIRFFRDNGKVVFFDAEHFFDGYKHNAAYAMETLLTAKEAGAACAVLCDTNGGSFPDEIREITRRVVREIGLPVGIHCHDDIGCAVANSILAVEAGCVQVQGTFIGYGERCGNANLSALIPSLQLKKDFMCIPAENMPLLTKTARYIAEVSNIILNNDLPYVGGSAFAHKGGMHIDAVHKNPASFEHIPPALVGNERQILLSEVAGRTALLNKIRELHCNIEKDSPEAQQLIHALKEKEYQGYQFEAAAASFEMLTIKELGRYTPYFESLYFKIIGEKFIGNDTHLSSAIVKVRVGDKEKISATEGDGPVHALDKALREALEGFYPALTKVRLTDYRVRVMEPGQATAAKVRVLIESTDGYMVWTTVGVSPDIIEASYKALVDSIEYKLFKDSQKIKEKQV